jgi:hypothetical protein
VAEAEPEVREELVTAGVAVVAVVPELVAPAEGAPGEPAALEEEAAAWARILGICGVRRSSLVGAVEPVQGPEDRGDSAAARAVAEVAVREAPDREDSAAEQEVAEVVVREAPEDREDSAAAREVAEVAVRGAPEALAA